VISDTPCPACGLYVAVDVIRRGDHDYLRLPYCPGCGAYKSRPRCRECGDLIEIADDLDLDRQNYPNTCADCGPGRYETECAGCAAVLEAFTDSCPYCGRYRRGSE
jgi:hypothetical protein